MKVTLLALLLTVATCVVATQCPSSIPAITTTITQSFQGANTAYEWTISPTNPVSQPPGDSTACSVPGYISQYTPGGSCDAVAQVQTASPTVNGNACVYSFSDGGTRSMTLTLSCLESSTALNLASTVPVTQNGNTFSYAFSGSYAGVCGFAPVASTTSVAPAITCPANIPVWTGQLSQVFNGQTSPYAWTISPTGTTSTPPQGSQQCSYAGYLSQYEVNGGCDAVAQVQTASPTVNGNACVYSFSDGGSRFMTLTLSCDSSATTMSMAPTVPVTQRGNGYVFAFSGKFAGVCGFAPITTTLTMSTATPSFEVFVLCQPNTTVAGLSAIVADQYHGRITSVVFNDDQTFTAYANFYTESARNTFIGAVNSHQVNGATTAGVVTMAPQPSADVDITIGLIIGLAIGGAVLAVFAVGVLVYCRCRRPQNTNAPEYGIPLFPTKETI